MKKVIRNISMLNERGELVPRDIYIHDGLIMAITVAAKEPLMPAEEVIEGNGLFAAPGLVDLHVHLREPGFEEKETIETGTASAARGGFTTICAMPNTDPTPDSAVKMLQIQKLIKAQAQVRVLPYASITKGLRSEELVDQKALLEAGAFAFTNDGVGVQTAGTMYQAMQQAAANHTTIVAHTEDDSLLYGGVMHAGPQAETLGLPGMLPLTESTQIARDVLLAEAAGCHYHICHVSSKESVRVIRDAKTAGIHVTAEVSPHHLLLVDDDILANDGNYKMNPPLRSTADRQALIEGLLDGTIDCIATDHAPHTAQEKQGGFVGTPFGIVGSETAFPLLYTHFVKTGIFTLKQLVDWMSAKPADLFSLPYGRLEVGRAADIALFDLAESSTIDPAGFKSKGRNTPFADWEVFGAAQLTLVGGEIVYSDQEVFA